MLDSRADGRVTSDHCRVTLRWVFTKSFLIAWNVEKRCLTVSRRSRDLRPLSRDRSATFFKFFFQLLETSKKRCLTVGRRSRDLNHCRVTVQRLFSKFSQIAWNVQKTLFDSRPTVAWPPTTVAWPFSDFFQNFPKSLETSKKRCLTVGRQKTLFDSRPTVAWPPTTVTWPFSDFFQKISNCLKRPKTLFDSRPTVAWPQPLSRDRSATFFKIFPNRLKRPKNVVWQSADGRVTSDHCRVTVQRLFSKFSQFAWNVQKTLFDRRPTVAWPPTTIAWPFSDFFQKNF